MKLRTVKSFVRRQGRITSKQWLTFENYGSQYILPSDSPLFFGNDYPIALDIGFGMGDALFQLAQDFPQWNFIGVEVHRPGVAHLIHLLQESNTQNVRIYHQDLMEIFSQVIPDNSLSAVIILFPDPWPKKRHQKRRLMNREFLEILFSKLKKGGQVLIKTDWDNYAKHIADTFSQFEKFSLISFENILPLFQNIALTKYQVKAMKAGTEIKQFAYKKPSPLGKSLFNISEIAAKGA